MDNTAAAEIPKSILIIKAQPKGLTALEGFLRNRSWTINSTSNVKDALKMLMTLKPSFVLISMDHQQKKVKSLPTMLSKSFPVQIFVFSESGRQTAFKGLKNAANIHMLHPPLTGNSVEQALLATMAPDEETQKIDAGSDAAVIKGGKREKKTWNNVNMAEASKMLQTNPAEDSGDGAGKSDLIWQEGAGPGPATKDFGYEEKDQSPTHAHIENEGLKGVKQQELEEAEKKRQHEISIQRKGGVEDHDHDHHEKKKAKEEAAAGLSFDGPKKRPGAEAEETPEVVARKKREAEEASKQEGEVLERAERAKAAAEEEAAKAKKEAQEARDKEFAEVEAAATKAEAEAKARVEEETKAKAEKKRQIEEEETEKAKTYGTVIEAKDRYKQDPSGEPQVRAASVDDIRQVLDLAFDKGDGKVRKPLDVTQKVTCLAMESEAASGYVLVAMGGDRVMDDKLIATITRLLSDMQVRVGNNSSWVPVPIQDVKFEEWAREEAVFVHKSVHEGDEVGVAFFEMQGAITKLGPSKNPDMGTVSLDDIAVDSPLAFDMRIFLNANQKFIYYLAKDARFLKTQRERLKRLGIVEIHVSKSQFQEVSAYRAQHAINGKIKDYKKGGSSDAA